MVHPLSGLSLGRLVKVTVGVAVSVSAAGLYDGIAKGLSVPTISL